MKKKLSKSACEKYMQCPASFDYHYNKGIRPIKTGSALVFGSAIDNALNAILLKQKEWKSEFKKAFDEVPVGDMLPLDNDYDAELLSEEDCSQLLAAAREHNFEGEDLDGLYSYLRKKLDENKPLTENQTKVYDLFSRFGLKAKAELFFIAYQKHVLPYIEKVHNVQKQAGPGFLDATVDWHKRGKIILDHKTSSKPYPTNAVEFSAQLAMYAAEEQITSVAYIVFLKNINKNRERICSKCSKKCVNNRLKTCDADILGVRCDGEFKTTIAPEAEVQIIHGDITPRAMEVAAELQREVQRAAEAKIFPCNVQQCNNQFGKPCIYRDLKWKGDMSGLKKVELKK